MTEDGEVVPQVNRKPIRLIDIPDGRLVSGDGYRNRTIEDLRTGQIEQRIASLNIDGLVLAAGCLDRELANKAQAKLTSLMENDFGHTAENAKPVDLMGLLGEYSLGERSLLVSRLAGKQSTSGCCGNCWFCVFGRKEGVTSKFTFDSEVEFAKTELPPEDELARSISLYWNSDPLDWRDDDHSFVDLYRVYREKYPNSFMFLATSVPSGGIDAFVGLVEAVYDEHWNIDQACNTTIRLSVGRHNLKRVEAAVTLAVKKLQDKGHSLAKIADFFNGVFGPVAWRTKDHVLKVGALYGQLGHDAVRDIDSPACTDGVMVSPENGFQAVMAVAATPYTPSGEIQIPLRPGFDESKVPEVYVVGAYGSDGNHTIAELVRRQAFYPPKVKVWDALRLYEMSNRELDMQMKAGREIMAGNIVSYVVRRINDDDTDSDEAKQTYLSGMSTEYKGERREYLHRLVATARERSLAGDSTEKRQMYRYYETMLMVTIAEMDMLTTLIDNGYDSRTVSAIADMILNIGVAQVDKLPDIVAFLLKESKQVRHFVRSVFDREKLWEEVYTKFGVAFDIDSQDTTKWPDWFKQFGYRFIRPTK